MRYWEMRWAFALVCVMAGVCQAQTRELSLRLIEAPAAGTTQPAQRLMPMRVVADGKVLSGTEASQALAATPMTVLSDGKVLRELRLAIECGRKFDVSVIVDGETWHLSGMAQASKQATDQYYRMTVEMELRSENGVDGVSTVTLAKHGKDAVLGGVVGGGLTRQWVLRIDDPQATSTSAAPPGAGASEH